MRKLVFLIPLALSACATGPSLASRMASFTGASEQSLVQNLGVPDKQVSVNGTLYLAYERRDLDVSPGLVEPYYDGGFYGGPFFGFGGPGPFLDAGFPARVNEISCETTFALRDDRVVGFTMRGDDCH